MDENPQGNGWMKGVMKNKKGILGVAIVGGVAAGAAYHFFYGSKPRKVIKEGPLSFHSLNGGDSGEEERDSLDPQSGSEPGPINPGDNHSSTSSGELKSNTPTSSKDSSRKKK